MTPSQVERKVAEYFAYSGAWATILKKGVDGNQPFDLIAIDNHAIWCVDVKLCKRDYLPFSRFEENQLNAMSYLYEIDNERVILGFVMVFETNLYFLDYKKYLEMLKDDKKSVKSENLLYLGKIVI